MSRAPGSIAIIGAGWSGLTCALELSAAGFKPTLFETNPTPGGRARRVAAPNGFIGDNGQHILLGAYAETLRQIDRVHDGKTQHLFHRFPLMLAQTKHYSEPADLVLMRHEIPLIDGVVMLARAQGLTLGEKFSFGWFLAKLMVGESPPLTMTVDQYVAKVAPQVRNRIIAPLCLAALNTPSVRASACVLRNVLRAAFRGPSSNSDMLIPRTDLSALFPEPALAKLRDAGCEIFDGETVILLNPSEKSVELVTRKRTAVFDHVIVATAPQHTARLLSPTPAFAGLASALSALDYEPITTLTENGYVSERLPPHPALIGVDDPHVQWVIHDTSRQQRCVIISGGDAHADFTGEEMIDHAAAALNTPAEQFQSICEKRATYSCTPQQHIRLKTLPSLRGPVWLAGDYCYPEFPATLEAATRSGRATANAIIGVIELG